MKHSLNAVLFTMSLAASANAALYTTGFGVATFPLSPLPAEIAGRDGWVISDTTPELSFLTNIGNGNALALGGYNSGPADDSVALSHSYVESVGRITSNFDFAIADSAETFGFTNRDAFGFSLNGASGSLFAVTFKPLAQTPNPDADSNAEWRAFFSVNGGADTSTGIIIEESGKYSFNLALSGAFQPGNVTTTDFILNVGGVTHTATVALNPQTATTDFAFNYITTFGAANAGDNFLAVDTLTVVPEPSSTLLLALTGLGLAARRRRA